jgi:hypothetical protein
LFCHIADSAWCVSADARERLGCGQDGDALVLLLEFEQVFIAGNDGLGACGERAGNR